MGGLICDNWQIGTENCGREPLASNQVVGGSNPSGRAKVINDLAHFRKLELSYKNQNYKVVIDGWGTIVGSVCNSGWFAYRPTTLGDSSSAKDQY